MRMEASNLLKLDESQLQEPTTPTQFPRSVSYTHLDVYKRQELYSAAMRKSGIGGKPVVSPVIQAALKRRKLKLTSTQLELPLTDPRQALKEIRASQLDDIDCFRKTLARVENLSLIHI